MSTPPPFMAAKAAASIIPVVSGVSGKCSESTSTTGSNSVRGRKGIGESATRCRLV